MNRKGEMGREERGSRKGKEGERWMKDGEDGGR